MGQQLLALAGCRASELGTLSAEDWARLDCLAQGHRLRPHLHGRLARGELDRAVPCEIASNWKEAHRANAIDVLVQRRALGQAAKVLEGCGIAAVALKGSALAWHVWPTPTERVMRDIDLLVPQDRAVEAYEALCEAGWRAPPAPPELLERLAREATHLPLLLSPDGVQLEVHAHLWASTPLPGLPMPRSDDAGVLERSVFDEALGMHVPVSEDMLAHLVVHCACSHLFNVGPLALADIDHLLAREAIDWQHFWARAERNGYARAAALVLALVDRWFRPGVIATSGCPVTTPAEEIERAEALLVQDPVARKDINAIAGLRLGRPRERMAQHPLDEAERRSGVLGRAGQLALRGVSVAGGLLDPETRRSGLETAAMARWLGGR